MVLNDLFPTKLELDSPFELFLEECYKSRISDILLIIGERYEHTVVFVHWMMMASHAFFQCEMTQLQ